MNFSESTPRWAKVMIALCSLAIGSCYVACQHRNAQPPPSATKPASPQPGSVVLSTKSAAGLTVVGAGDLNATPAAQSSAVKPGAVVLGTKSMGGLVPAPLPQPLPPSQESPQQQQQVQQIQR